MASYNTSEDNVVILLSGFNQLFLGFVLINIILVTCLGIQDSKGNLIIEDYDFDVKTALERTKNHGMFVGILILLALAAVLSTSISNIFQRPRSWRITIFDSMRTLADNLELR